MKPAALAAEDQDAGKESAKRPSLLRFLLFRYVASLVVVSVVTTGVIYWLIAAAQTSAIKMSLETTNEFLMNAVQYQVRYYEFESLQRSLEAFRQAFNFVRIEVIGPYGQPIANAGELLPGVSADVVLPIRDDSGTVFGEVAIWHGRSQSIWATSSESAALLRILVSGIIFLVTAVGYSLFFFHLVNRHVDQPMMALAAHMNMSQKKLGDHVKTTDAAAKIKAIPIPSRLTRFQETAALGRAYSRLEARWIDADFARSQALENERYQRSILLEVLHLAQITVALMNADGTVHLIGTPLPENLARLILESGLDASRIVAESSAYQLDQSHTPASESGDPSFVAEFKNRNARNWSLHKATVGSRNAIILREVTHERDLEDALLRSARLQAIGAMSASIAHDFNNVIATILVNLDVAKEMVAEGQGVPLTLLDKIGSIATGISDRISGIRRLSIGDKEVHLETVDQYLRLEELQVFIAPTLGASINLTMDLQDRRPILCDGNEFESCIINLLVNAKRALNGAGDICIRTRKASDQDLRYVDDRQRQFVAIDIEDSGAGVPAGIAERIFDPFFSTEKLGQGTGLGLAQVRAFCVRSGGNVYLHPPGKGGAVFTLLLPVSNEKVAKAPVRVTIPRTSLDKLHVYILDDNEMLGNITAQLLTTRSIQATAYSSLNKLRLAGDGRRMDGVLLSDVHMPDCDYRDVAAFACENGNTLRLAFYSGNSEAFEDIRRQYPAIPTLLKPFQTDKLVELLTALAGADQPHLSDPV